MQQHSAIINHRLFALSFYVCRRAAVLLYICVPGAFGAYLKNDNDVCTVSSEGAGA